MNKQWISRQAGLTLVELMVAVAINLVIVIAAAYLYLSSRTAQRLADERSGMFENGQLALEIIGREIGNAGFYPVVRFESPELANVVGGYINPGADTASSPLHAGLFGCNAQSIAAGNEAAPACANHATTGLIADSLMVNYYTDDAEGAEANAGRDCAGERLVNRQINIGRLTVKNVAPVAGSNDVPATPLFASNVYMLRPITASGYSTLGLSCQGLGATGSQPLVPGIEQMRILYAVRGTSNLMPQPFVDAATVTQLTPVVIGDDTLNGWQRVVAVKVCILVRSMTGSSSSRDLGRTLANSQNDCYGNRVEVDGIERRRMEQVFGVKNHQTQTFVLGG